MKEVDQFILLRTLYESGRLSRRSYSLCNLAELVTLGDLKSFYESHKDFMCFEDYDRESNEELILLSRQTFSIDELSLDRSGFEKYKALPPKQLEQLHNHLMLLLLQLPVRQYNIIARILNNKIQPEKIINLILTKEFRFDRIVNVGKVSLISTLSIKSSHFLAKKLSGFSQHGNHNHVDYFLRAIDNLLTKLCEIIFVCFPCFFDNTVYPESF